MHDPRVGRFFATDPLEAEYPWYTPYSFSGNKVIAFKELEGKEETWAIVNNEIVRAGPAANYYTSYEAAAKVLNKQKETMSRQPTLVQDNRTYEQKKAWHNSVQMKMNEVEIQKQYYANPTNMIAHGVAIGVPELVLDLATEGAFSYVKTTRIFKTISNSKIAAKTVGTFNGAFSGTYKVFNSLPINQKINLRQSLAKSWGLEMDYVDFNKSVYTETLEEGTVLIQYRLRGYEGTKGLYYANPGTKPEQIGLRTQDIGETQMVITKGQQKVIISSHKENSSPYYDKSGAPVEGGGQQIKSDNLKFETNSTSKKID